MIKDIIWYVIKDSQISKAEKIRILSPLSSFFSCVLWWREAYWQRTIIAIFL